ncbi:MAG: DEAD/DEAH box helicase [Clostridiales bacterium]|nr:DEAD/DEAH box helicase [Clostridiales bacterium]
MNLQDITQAINSRLGIATLNPMQQTMSVIKSNDVILLAPTGSGKTIAFAIYMLRHVTVPPQGYVQAVVIAPSRELVLQIGQVLRSIATGLKVVTLYGGHAMADEVNSLTAVPDIIVATPGRLLDHIHRHQVNLDRVSTLVLDEYDKSLELGFAGEMERIVRHMSRVRHYVLTSATAIDNMPAFIHLDSAKLLDYTPSTPSPRSRTQIVEVPSASRDKLDTLLQLLHSLPNERVIVFVNHRESAERVYHAVKKAGLPSGLYHGALEQRQRQLSLDLFDNGTTPVLVATDLAARGLDIDDVGAVIHYHMPVNAEAWTHRNGRTARQDASGTIYAITSESDNIPEYVDFDRQYVPSGHSDDPIHSNVATLYFNAGRREKISRGDIAGYLINRGGLASGEIGRISVSDHSAIAAVPRTKVAQVMGNISQYKLKNQRVRVTPVSSVE